MYNGFFILKVAKEIKSLRSDLISVHAVPGL